MNKGRAFSDLRDSEWSDDELSKVLSGDSMMKTWFFNRTYSRICNEHIDVASMSGFPPLYEVFFRTRWIGGDAPLPFFATDDSTLIEFLRERLGDKFYDIRKIEEVPDVAPRRVHFLAAGGN